MKTFNSIPVLGILGGMGPAATIDLQQRILSRSPAQRDQEHIPTVVWNHGAIPDRQLALAGRGESPFAAMLDGLRLLEKSGVSKIAIPCNTAHYWHAELQQQTEIEIFNLVQLTVDHIRQHRQDACVGILATKGALFTQLYQHELEAQDIAYIVNTVEDVEELVMPACYAVKSNNWTAGGQAFEIAGQKLIDQGANALILACTEIPIGLQAIQSELLAMSYDTTTILADTCIRWFYGSH
ncbi:MAG: amino acid racemase [Acinetobacter sp.]